MCRSCITKQQVNLHVSGISNNTRSLVHHRQGIITWLKIFRLYKEASMHTLPIENTSRTDLVTSSIRSTVQADSHDQLITRDTRAHHRTIPQANLNAMFSNPSSSTNDGWDDKSGPVTLKERLRQYAFPISPRKISRKDYELR
jgi:hypothetical protein